MTTLTYNIIQVYLEENHPDWGAQLVDPRGNHCTIIIERKQNCSTHGRLYISSRSPLTITQLLTRITKHITNPKDVPGLTTHTIIGVK